MSESKELLGGALEGGLEREIIANIIGGYEQWKAEQSQLDGGRRMRGGRSGGEIAGGQVEQPLEGGKTSPSSEMIEGGEGEIEGGKKRGRKLSKRRYIKLKSGKRSLRYVCSRTSKRKSHSRKRRSHSRKRRSGSRRRMSSWNRRVSSYRRKHGVTMIQAAMALRRK
jgi:hypothetical protein